MINILFSDEYIFLSLANTCIYKTVVIIYAIVLQFYYILYITNIHAYIYNNTLMYTDNYLKVFTTGLSSDLYPLSQMRPIS